MKILITTPETFGKYCVMEMQHQPNIGPAIHAHPRGNETFYILEGHYLFYYGDRMTELSAGELLTVEADIPHYYKSGSKGGRLLIIMPPDLENYFWEVSTLEHERPLPFSEELQIAEKYGQNFLNQQGQASHW